MSKYASLTKDQLIEEIKTRREAGHNITVDLRWAEDKLIAALETDDIENGEGGNGDNPTPLQPAPEKPKKKVKNPEVEDQLEAEPELVSEPTQPSDEDFAKGFKAVSKNHINPKTGKGYVYQALNTKDGSARPFKARIPAQASGHPGFFWEGSEAEFDSVFKRD